MMTTLERLEKIEPKYAAKMVACVDRGASLLDRLDPGWWERIAADDLAMRTCDRCVLGQLYGDYRGGCKILCKHLPTTFLFSAAEHGFTLPDREQPDWSHAVPLRFAALAQLWRERVSRRMEAQ